MSYRARVADAYRLAGKNNSLSPNLIQPSPAKIREECLLVCQERYLKKDEPLFRAFFEPHTDKADYMLAIKTIDTDKFRPLCNFLRNEEIKTSEINVELLAWLIDYPQRPFRFDENYSITTGPGEQTAAIEQTITIPVIEIEPNRFGEKNAEEKLQSEEMAITEIRLSKKRLFFKYSLIGLTMILIVSMGIYGLIKIDHNACMIWSNDHYASAPCNIREAIVMAPERLAHLKKINKPDTITGRALGYTWYFKSDTGMEYYTAGGDHPVHPERRLKPLTQYMLNKYIRHL